MLVLLENGTAIILKKEGKKKKSESMTLSRREGKRRGRQGETERAACK